MPRYHVNARFGPWLVGDEFESEDDFHANMAAESGILTEVGVEADDPSSGWAGWGWESY